MPMEMYTLGLPQERQTLVRVNDERPPCLWKSTPLVLPLEQERAEEWFVQRLLLEFLSDSK